jgi:uncharacterized membrane protein YdjX (TVP38/TMEM64 family)
MGSGNPVVWLRAAALVVTAGLLLVIWQRLSVSSVDLQQLSAWLAPHRHAWYALPVVVAAFVLLGLVMVPVILLIAATGVAFGPWLGPPYAMAGCLASASADLRSAAGWGCGASNAGVVSASSS